MITTTIMLGMITQDMTMLAIAMAPAMCMVARTRNAS